MSLFFYLFSFAIDLWHWKFVIAWKRHCSVCQQSTWYSATRVHSKDVDRRIFWEKLVLISWRKCCGTQALLTGG